MALHFVDFDVAGPCATLAQIAAAGRAAIRAVGDQALTVVPLTRSGTPSAHTGPARASAPRTGCVVAVTRVGFLLQDARGLREFYLWADLWASHVAVQGPGAAAFRRAFSHALKT